ncbi:hypothetical protein A9Q87_13385 [Flavobacteriales bacterium 34_180_T64]|nr:hypothetical protein A9Q87_13385 [Flavobacteriales bacterium 34_180_T64]
METEKQQACPERSRRVPELRFNEFNGDWSESRLNDVAEFKKGKGISKADISEDGVLECIRYGELYTTYTELIQEIVSKTNLPAKDLILSEFNDVIIPASGESNIDIATASCVLKSGVAYSGDLNVIRSKMDGIFLSFYLNNKRKFDIARLAQGVSVVHLYSSQLKTLKLNFPSLPEQQKIASFLSAVDEKIQQLTTKKNLLEQYKKGVMQQLFSQQLRFTPNLDDVEDLLSQGIVVDLAANYPDWEEKRLNEFCTFFSGGTPSSTNKDYYTGTIPFIGSGNIYDSEVFSFISEEALNSSSAKLVERGDLLYALYGANSGESAISNLEGAINQAILCIRTKESIEYLNYILVLNKDKIVSKYLQGGQGNLSAQIIRKLKYKFPCLEEQQKIATYLSSIDTKIEAINNQITQTQTFKKGLLQQLFV